jgi:glycosyltransferase involved in cell wall biosynthesis
VTAQGETGRVPRVSVLIPARNEAARIEACLRSVLAQEAPGGLEVVVADGASTDGTADLARAAGARVVPNPRGITPAGLNRALAAARGSVVVRFDAHAEMPPGYVAACLRALDEEAGAVNVGGWRDARGDGPWARATGAALASRFGVGNPRIWRRPSAGAARVDVETVPLGAWPADALRAAGGWSEEFVRNQDFELNNRLRRANGRVVFDPAIWSIYHPRESLRALARQYWEYGLFKARMLREDPSSLRPRQLAPVGLLAAAVLALGPKPVARPARSALLAYLLLLGAVAARGEGGWRTAPVLATMHLTWVAGLLRGLARRA